jgi:signal transduction histidine kinase
LSPELKEEKKRYHNLVAHKLLTPLATISANLSLLRRPDLIRTPEQRDEAILDAEMAVRKLRRAIDCMLALREVAPGTASHTPGQAAEEILEMQAAGARLRYPARNAQVETDLNLQSQALPLSPEELEALVDHLLDNALQFCEKPEARVRIHASSDGPSILLRVEDNGRGIEPEDQERVFQRFVQCGERVAECIGVGLGLSLVRDIVNARGGTISLDSSPGVGTTVCITLPTV